MLKINKKLRDRVLSSVLVIASLISLLPMQVLSVGQDPSEGNQNVSAPEAGAEKYTLALTLDGEAVSMLLLHPYEKREIWAEGAPETAAYQWQILHPKQEDLWVNIYDATGPSLAVTKALVGNMLDADNTAQLRCRVTVGQNHQYSDVLTVVMGEAAPEVTVVEAELTEVPGATPLTGGPATPGSVQQVNSDGVVLADGDDVPEFVTVTIYYYRYDYELQEDGITMQLVEMGEAFTPYVAALKSGSDLNTVVSCPTIVGYDAYLATEENGVKTENPCKEVAISLTDIQSNVTYTVNYKPAKVDYSVRYFFQNIYDDLYVENPELVKDTLKVDAYPVQETGETGLNPDMQYTHAKFDGFTSLYYEPEKIAADGSTEFYVYYERDYVLMEFDCNGGYGTDTLYVRYGTYISVPEPVRSGWNFAGWDLVRSDAPDATDPEDGVKDELPLNMPHYNTAYKALWTEKEHTPYSVAYWIINDDGSRTYLGGVTKDATTGEEVSGYHDLDDGSFHICNMEAHTHDNDCFVCGKKEHTHIQGCFERTLAINYPGDNGEASIRAFESGGDPEPGYIYVIQVSKGNGTYTNWPKLYLEGADGKGSYYTIDGIGAGDNAATDDQIKSIVDGEPIGGSVSSTYGTETHTVTKYKAKMTCGLEHHVHSNACRVCREHTHTDDCYQSERHLEEVKTKVIFVKDGDVVREKKADDPETLEVVAEYETSKNLEVQGDGATVVDVYYRFKQYTLKFYYAASKQIQIEDKVETRYYILGGSTYFFGHGEGTATYDDFKQLNKAFDQTNQSGYTSSGVAPSLNKNGQDRVAAGVYIQQAEYDNTSKRTYYSISFTARYGDNIAEKWPVDVFDQVEMADGQYNANWGKKYASVSAWNGEYYVKYSQENSNETIKGKYEVLDENLLYISDPPAGTADPNVVSYLCFWENGAPLNAGNRWNIPRLFRYNIWVEALNSEIVYDGNGNASHKDGLPIVYREETYFKRIDSYDTCDNAGVDAQTQVALEGYREKYFANGSYPGYYYTPVKDSGGTKYFEYSILEGTTDEEKLKEDGYYNSALYANGYSVNFYFTCTTHSLKFWNYNSWLGQGKGAGNEGEGGGVRFGTPLSLFGDYVTADFMAQPQNYPSGLEPGAYEFKGWYTSPGCLDGTEVVWSDTMPDADLTLYAKWDPVVHDVYFYYDYENYTLALDAKEEDKNQYYWYHKENGDQKPESYPIKVSHGSLLGTAYSNIPEANPGYTFVGWFYIDETGKKRFAPDTMEVKQPLHLFAEWKSGIDTQYEVTYVLDEDGTPIAEPTTGHLTAGKTKTFTAKVGPELDPKYQNESLFPMANSHSILMAENSAENVYEFRYLKDEVVYYRVRYINKVTGVPMCEDKVAVSKYAIVTEKFIPFAGFIPDKYYARKVLAYDGSATEPTEQNEIIFYYTPDTKHGPFVTEYYTPVLGATEAQLYDASGNPVVTYTDGSASPYWTLQQSEVGMADIDSQKTEGIQKNKFEGFLYNMATVTTYDEDGNPTVDSIGSDANSVSGKVTQNGLEIRIFYARQSYDYEIRFVEYGTGDVLGYGHLDEDGITIKTNTDGTPVFSDVDTDRFPFGSTIEYAAPDTIQKTENGETTRYIFFEADGKKQEQKWTIRASNTRTNVLSADRTENVLTFYYKVRTIEIFYLAVCSVADAQDFGVVDLNYERAASAGTLSGSNAIAGDGFAFKGWFTDMECTNPVDNKWRFDPGPTNATSDDQQRDDGTKLKPQSLPDADRVVYYALFEPVKENIQIKVEGENLGDDTFLFRVTGKDVLGNQVDLIVSIQGAGSVTVKDLYCGTYTVTELTDWSWAYDCTGAVSQTVKLTTEDKDADDKLLKDQITTYDVDFENASKSVDWLHGESMAVENQFKIAP